MSDLGISHLPGRQADVPAGSAQLRVRTGHPQAIEIGRARLADRVIGLLLAAAPTVEDDQHDGAIFLHSYSSSG